MWKSDLGQCSSASFRSSSRHTSVTSSQASMVGGGAKQLEMAEEDGEQKKGPPGPAAATTDQTWSGISSVSSIVTNELAPSLMVNVSHDLC